ncbi:metal-dependent hydrolase [Methanococcoides sp. NM1]|uniref:metal-dependent hydrolase n=1 Tax=Methanococcoides sp. NM1 TaxID=1201013 RepID=UPI001082E89E|nr:metal-dependent hydrolase [Methanococcoides sp. NM1]
MFILGHLGVTLGIFFILEHILPPLKGRLDYRYIAFGALLPDILDKLIGRVIFAETIGNGRIIGHTLAFCLVITLLSYYRYRLSKDTHIFQITGACFFHLLEDRMWTAPETLFWPALGWDFPVCPYPDSVIDYFLNMIMNSYVPSLSLEFIAESIGGCIIVVLVVAKYLRHR